MHSKCLYVQDLAGYQMFTAKIQMLVFISASKYAKQKLTVSDEDIDVLSFEIHCCRQNIILMLSTCLWFHIFSVKNLNNILSDDDIIIIIICSINLNFFDSRMTTIIKHAVIKMWTFCLYIVV